ncbi:radical SAM protein [Desulfobulbus sp.]|uniref:radical SAM protein n=1 Tax=Desulfobulbus sp. TaxID=895 RepID=UPI00286F2C33|nr:radical SAM protein [Desulfobulbus sp.]
MARQSRPHPAAHRIDYLILPLTTRCNLRCRYCYHGTPATHRDMDRAAMDQAFALAASGTGPLHIQLTGGEPCLVPHLIEAAGERARRLSRPWTMAMQTNGTCLDRKIVDLIGRFHLQVGVSLDGSPWMQESLRGQATETLRGLMLLEAQKIPFRVTTVVCGRNADQLDRLAWLLAAFRQARGLGLDLLVMKGHAGAHAESPGFAESGALIRGVEALVRALTAINRQRETPLRLREWDLVRRMLALPGRQSARTFCRAGAGTSLAVHPDGRCFPCGQTLADERFELPAAETAAVLPLLSPSLAALRHDCGACPLMERCPGDCPSRLLFNPAPARFLACDLYRTLARACIEEQTAPRQPVPRPADAFARRETCHP